MHEDSTSKASTGRLVRIFRRLEELGNRLPDPVTMFLILAAVVVCASWLFSGIEVDVAQRSGGSERVAVRSLLSVEGIRWMLTSAVDNFINFAPLGPVLTMMLGLGIAERSGWISTGLCALVRSVPEHLLTATVVFAGIMSSMAADAGYVVLTPLGAILFATAGRHPIAGLAAAFAGVSGGYSANLLITGLDPLLARLTSQAANMIDATYHVNPTANYYFMLVSTFLITAVGAWVTERVVEPTLGSWDPESGDASFIQEDAEVDVERWHAFRSSLWVLAVGLLLVGLLAVGPGSVLRIAVPEGTPTVASLAPLFDAIEVLVAVLFLLPALWFGWRTKAFRSDKDIARMAADTMGSMGPYLVLAFAAGQFVAYFNWTGLGVVTAVNGANLLRSAGLGGAFLLVLFVIASGSMNLLVGSASAKWAFMAPVFVPMLMLVGFSPELVQAGYRVGDSVTNIISPLMPYFPIVIVFAQRYNRKAGIGTLMATMLPYSIAFAVAWTVLLFVWFGFGLPLGPGASTVYPISP